MSHNRKIFDLDFMISNIASKQGSSTTINSGGQTMTINTSTSSIATLLTKDNMFVNGVAVNFPQMQPMQVEAPMPVIEHKNENIEKINSCSTSANTEKYVSIGSRWDTSTRTTYSADILRNTHADAKILGFSIHRSHFSGESNNRVIIDFNNQESATKFIALCPLKIQDFLSPSKVISSYTHELPTQKELYVDYQPVSYQFIFQDNPPCIWSNGKGTLTEKKLKDILDAMNQFDSLDKKTLKSIYCLFEIPESSLVMEHCVQAPGGPRV